MLAHFTLSPKSTASTPLGVLASPSAPLPLALPTVPKNTTDSAIRNIFFIYFEFLLAKIVKIEIKTKKNRFFCYL
jgi:hypothetical protein